MYLCEQLLFFVYCLRWTGRSVQSYEKWSFLVFLAGWVLFPMFLEQ